MLAILTKYYGVDLVAAALTVLSIYWLGNHERRGFSVGFGSNLLWIIVAIWSQGVGLLITNVVLAGLNLRGYLVWNRHHS